MWLPRFTVVKCRFSRSHGSPAATFPAHRPVWPPRRYRPPLIQRTALWVFVVLPLLASPRFARQKLHYPAGLETQLWLIVHTWSNTLTEDTPLTCNFMKLKLQFTFFIIVQFVKIVYDNWKNGICATYSNDMLNGKKCIFSRYNLISLVLNGCLE